MFFSHVLAITSKTFSGNNFKIFFTAVSDIMIMVDISNEKQHFKNLYLLGYDGIFHYIGSDGKPPRYWMILYYNTIHSTIQSFPRPGNKG